MIKAVLFDLDQTLSDTSPVAHLRDAKNWSEVYRNIPFLTAFKGISELIEELNSNNIAVIIITTSPSSYCTRIVNHFGWKTTGHICYHDVSRRKPHPESFLKAIKDYNLDISKTISAGDRDIDIIASRSAGIPSIACTWASQDKSALLKEESTFIADNPEELIGIVRKFFSIKVSL